MSTEPVGEYKGMYDPEYVSYQDKDYTALYRGHFNSIANGSRDVLDSARGTINRYESAASSKQAANQMLAQLNADKARMLAGDPTAAIDAQLHLSMYQGIMALAEDEQRKEGEAVVGAAR